MRMPLARDVWMKKDVLKKDVSIFCIQIKEL